MDTRWLQQLPASRPYKIVFQVRQKDRIQRIRVGSCIKERLTRVPSSLHRGKSLVKGLSHHFPVCLLAIIGSYSIPSWGKAGEMRTGIFTFLWILALPMWKKDGKDSCRRGRQPCLALRRGCISCWCKNLPHRVMLPSEIWATIRVHHLEERRAHFWSHPI